MAEKTLLEIKDLVVEYVTKAETVHAVNGVSFSLNKGETIGLVGETGAGKTTTALSILRLLPERTGKIRTGEMLFNGEDLMSKSVREMQSIRGDKIAMIFQDPMTALDPVMTVGDQIYEALAIHNPKASKDELNKRVDEVLKMVGILPQRKNEYPLQFSGGMRQRIVIAIALVCEPELLIADEPTTALDVTIQAQVLKMMRNLRDQLGTAMIMITHDLGIVAEICDKVAVMYAGTVVEQGTLADVFTGEKHHPYTVGLFNAVPNIKDDEAKRLKPIDGLMPDPTNLPEGCCFCTRCPHATERCKQEKPAVLTEGTHSICCHLFDKEVK